MSSAAAATNTVTRPAQSQSSRDSRITVNLAIPVGGMDRSLREAIQKIASFGNLAANWDGQGSNAPSWGVRQAAIDFLLTIPGTYPTPRVVPVSGGGFNFEWTIGNRELEVCIEPNGSLEVLRVENGMPLEYDSSDDLPAVFGWLASQ